MPLPNVPQKYNVPIAFAAGIALMFGMQIGTSRIEGQVLQTNAEPNPQVQTLIKQTEVLQKQLKDQQLEQDSLLKQLKEQNKSAKKTTTKKLSTNKAQLIGGGQECTTDAECPGATSVCNAQQKCQQLQGVRCTCSQDNVLQCADPTDRAKHTFCPERCEEKYSSVTKQVEARCI